jgi:hypothetical protein
MPATSTKALSIFVAQKEKMPHEITVSWDASPQTVSGYNIYRGTAADNESNVPLNGGTLITTTSFTDTTVFPGVTYFYEVTAVFGGVESVDSIEIKAPPVPFDPSPTKIDMGNSASFEILAGSTVTNVPGSPTRIAGDVGVWPGTSITGFGSPTSISGSFHAGDFVAENAQAGLTAAYNQAANAVNPPGVGAGFPATGPYSVTSCTTSSSGSASYVGTYPAGSSLIGQSFTVTGFTNGVNNGTFVCTAQTITALALNNPGATAETATASVSGLASSGSPSTTLPSDIGGMTLAPGVYSNGSSVGITGTLVLDAQGNPNAVWVFQIGSTLTTATSNSSIVLAGGAQSSNVYWQVGSSATLGTGTDFAGTIMAQASITANTGARVDGRLLARTGAVTLNGNSIIEFIKSTLSLYAPNKFFDIGTVTFDCGSQSFQQVIRAGISGATRPNFSNVLGVLTTDGTIVWASLDPPDVSILISLPPSGPNNPPAPPAAPLNPRVTSED